jgi:hypothetical protein
VSVDNPSAINSYYFHEKYHESVASHFGSTAANSLSREEEIEKEGEL